jgi:hypothetical protein
MTMTFSKVLRYALFAAAIAGMLASLPDIKRYIKISMM